MAAVGPGAARVTRHSFRVPSPGASSPGPREMLVPSTASSTISSSLSMAAGDPAQLRAARLPPVPPGAPAAGRALGLNPASLEEEEEEEEQSGLARTASPYSPFDSLAFSCCAAAGPPPFAHLPLASEAPGCRRGRRRRNFLL